MKKGLLLCSGGMSTTMMAKGLNDIAKKENVDFKWDAKGVMTASNWIELIDEYDFVFMSPQIVFKHAEIKQVADEKGIASSPIKPTQYIVFKCPELWDIVKKALNI